MQARGKPALDDVISADWMSLLEKHPFVSGKGLMGYCHNLPATPSHFIYFPVQVTKVNGL